MRITEISSPSQSQSQPQPQQQQQTHSHTQEEETNHLVSQIESLIKRAEPPPPPGKPFLHTVSRDLRQCLTQLSQLAPFSNSLNLHLWKLSYCLWNACVDLSNTSSFHRSSNDHASLRHIAADLLFLAGKVIGVPSPAAKSASFYYKTGLIWLDLQNFDLASTCFERASDLISKADLRTVSDVGERKLFFDLIIARSRTAWEVSDRNLSLALLNRAKTLLFGSPEHFKALANQYMTFGKMEMSKNENRSMSEALKLMNEALDLYEKGLLAAKSREESLDFKILRSKALRFISAVNLQIGEFECVIKCLRVLREGDIEDNHPSLPVLAMKAWLGLGKYAEAEKELRGMVVNNGIPEGVWVSAVEAYTEAAGTAGAETAKGVFMGLLGRCHISTGATVRVVHGMVGDGRDVIRARIVAEMVSDERVVALFKAEAEAKQRKAIHALLWNWYIISHFLDNL